MKRISVIIYFLSMLLPCLSISGSENSDDGKRHCFVFDTQITMSDDTMKDIAEIEEGDVVLTFNVEKRTCGKAIVKKVHMMTTSRTFRIRVSNGSTVEVTSDHPFLATTGWVSISPELTKQYEKYKDVEVGQLDVATELLYYNLTNNLGLKVVSIDGFMHLTETYSLELDGDDAYAANSFWVGQE